MAQNESTSEAFLNVKGAFNKVRPSAITGALMRLDKQIDIVNWISKLLCERMIFPTQGDSKIMRKAEMGTPKMSVLFSLFGDLATNVLMFVYVDL